MGLGVSILLIAAGAILAFAVNTQVSGVDIQTVGWILLIVGIVGAVLSMIFWSTWAGPGYWSRPSPRGVRRGRAPAGLLAAERRLVTPGAASGRPGVRRLRPPAART